jgi:hypothetical protein
MFCSFRPPRVLLVAFTGVLVFLGLLTGCQRAIETLQPTETPLPTRTRRPATPTSTLVPTAAASLTPSITPTATPDTRIQSTFPLDVNPLTGEKVADPAVLDRRPLAIKVSNYPPQVRPQRGLSQADLVFEHILEGVTRLTAVFYSQTPELVGSVRSGRYLDLEIVPMYKAFFAYSGSSGGIKLRIQNAPWFNRVMTPDFGVPESGDPFARIPQGDMAFEHTLFAKPPLLYKWAQNHGMDNSRQDLKGLSFSDVPIGQREPASGVVISYTWRSPHPAEVVSWRYDATTGRYLRSADGVAWTDANNNQPISAANVIVVYANHVTDCMIQENTVGVDPDCKLPGQYSIQIQIWGEGPVQIFRDGKVLNGRWVRPNPDDMLTFVGADGKPLPLKRGNSWYQMVPTDLKVKVEP